MPPKPKSNSTNPNRDDCQTPPCALEPLYPYLPKEWVIWEPAAGKGNLVNALREKGYKVLSSDIKTSEDFFYWKPYAWDVIITNPPFSQKYKWLQRCYSLGKPFALLMPVDVIGAAAAQKLFKECGFEWMFFNRRINYEMPNLGYSGRGAQFSSAWFTWKLTSQPIQFVDIHPR